MFDFDSVGEWEARLRTAVADLLPHDVNEVVAKEKPEFVEDARDLVLRLSKSRRALIERVGQFIETHDIAGYHGTRLLKDEVVSIREIGLQVLRPDNRMPRLRAIFAGHPNQAEILPRLQGAVDRVGPGHAIGRRENQAHLTLSRIGLVAGFNHYLKYGSEFDQHVARALLGPSGPDFLGRATKPYLVKVSVPGREATQAANPYGTGPEDIPNIARHVISLWSWRIINPKYSATNYKADCGMVFRRDIPANWVQEIIPIDDAELK